MVVSLGAGPLCSSTAICLHICNCGIFHPLLSNNYLSSKRRAKRVKQVQLRCVATDKRASEGNWNFKTTATLVEHTYTSARNILEDLGNAGGNIQSKGRKGSEQQQVAIAATSSSWEYPLKSSRLRGESHFGILLGLVTMVLGAVSIATLAFNMWWKDINKRNDIKEVSKVLEAPSAFSLFLKKDVRRKETVEWVNMVLGKLWRVYRRGLETWLVGLLQPLIDNLNKPNYVRRVEIQQFHLGDEPLSVRSVERRTSRRANDLQYLIGLRYTGEAKMLLSITLAAGFLPVNIPVRVRGLDIDGEVWVKLRLIPSEPWVGTATWAFVSLPKIILALAPFGLFNIMTIPFISRFLTKLLTEDLPMLFVKPNKVDINFANNQPNKMSPFVKQFRDEAVNIDNTNKNFAGELSVTLVDARKLNYSPIGKTDPYVVFTLGDQVVHSKKNSQTSVIGPPGAPIWNQDFQLLVVNPKTQKLTVRVRDNMGLGILTVGRGEIDLSTLQDTVPTDKIVPLRKGWSLFPRRFAGELMLRLTYKAYVEDEDDDDRPLKGQVSDSDSDSEMEKDQFSPQSYYRKRGRISFMRDLFTAVNTVIKDLGYDNVRVVPKSDNKGVGDVEPKSTRNPLQNNNKDLNVEPSNKQKAEPEARESSGSFNENKAVDEPREANNNLDNDAMPAVNTEADSTKIDTEILPSTSRRWQIQRLSENTVVLWLGIATGIALLAALSLNFSNLVNP